MPVNLSIENAPDDFVRRLRLWNHRSLQGELLVLSVADDGPGVDDLAQLSHGRGVGLRNTRERLAVLYGDRARLASHDAQPGLRIDIEFPAEFAA